MPGILIIDEEEKSQAAENAAFFCAYFQFSHFRELFDPAYIHKKMLALKAQALV